MERRGGLCIARYGGDPDAAWRVGRIMLRFRPIAPKPAAGGGATPAAEACAPRMKRKGAGGREGRRGRKGRRVSAMEEKEPVSNSPSSSNSSSSNSSAGSPSAVVTLPLMPETPERREAAPPADQVALPWSPPAAEAASPADQVALPWRPPAAVAAGGTGAGGCAGAVVVVAPRPVWPAGSWVTLECVTDTWRDGEVGPAGDDEVRKGMEGSEACPAFMSDEWGRVTWMNEAYKKMVLGRRREGEGEEEVRVALLTKGSVPAACRAFACRVRVRYASRGGRGSLTAPCDVWRLDAGGLAWKLDVRAALSLSLGS